MNYVPLLLIALVLNCPASFAQNPDGKNVSLHLTPVWNWGTVNFSQITNVWYPNSISSVENVLSEQAGIIHHPLAFGIHTQVKIPTTSYLSLTLSYSYDQKFEEHNSASSVTQYFSQYWKYNGSIHALSVTVSLYNLFSIYRE